MNEKGFIQFQILQHVSISHNYHLKGKQNRKFNGKIVNRDFNCFILDALRVWTLVYLFVSPKTFI